MAKLKTFLLSCCVFLISTGFSSAVVLIQNATEEATGADILTAGVIETGAGQAGNFELIACMTSSNGSNQFLNPAPGGWNSIIQEGCPDSSCILGVWTRFSGTPDSEDITCSWTDSRKVFVAGSFRYSGADAQNPIVDNIVCSEGTGSIATAPSIFAVTRSQLVRIAAGTIVEENQNDVLPEAIEADGSESDQFSATAFFGNDSIGTRGTSNLLFKTGETGTADLSLNPAIDRWVACTLAIRMGPPEPIPALSEWGFIAVAAFMGIAGLWVLRRSALKV